MTKTQVIVGAAAAVGGAVVFMTTAAMSYVTSAGDQTRWGVRVFRALGIAKTPIPPLTSEPVLVLIVRLPSVEIDEESREERDDTPRN